jgi:D-amino-acid dehydrogenase
MRVAVAGAGMVGVSCALALQEKGFDVTLIDRRAPGEETSFGNAGVIARSSLIPFNNPKLWRALPYLLKNNSPGFRYDSAYLRRNIAWGARFLAHARTAHFAQTTRALDALISLSISEHKRWRDTAQIAPLYRDTGWIFCYRTDASFDASAWQREVLRAFDVSQQALDAEALHALEPDLANVFPRALWVKDAMSVDEPGRVVRALAKHFVSNGGKFIKQEVPAAQFVSAQGQWQLRNLGLFDHLVVALGPWSPDYLAPLGINIPMAFERGMHQHFLLREGTQLNRPIYDVSGGYVLAPMANGVRLSTGVELAARDAIANPAQLALATRAAQNVLPMTASPTHAPWLGARPTLPDSRPMIGASSRYSKLWCAFGHQHIGFSTGPGTGAIIADMISGANQRLDATAFSPSRFLA